MRFSNLRIGLRLGLGFGLVIVLTALMCLIAITKVYGVSDLAINIYQQPYAVMEAALGIENQMIMIDRYMDAVIAAPDETELNKAVKEIAAMEAEMLLQFDTIAARFTGDRQRLDQAKQMFAGWRPIRERIIELMRQGRTAKAETTAKAEASDHALRLRLAMDSFVILAKNEANKYAQAAKEAKDSAYYTIMRLGAVMVFISIGFAWSLTRGITRPVRQALHVVQNMAKGDLTIRVESDRRDETGRMLSAMGEMVDRLSEMIGSNVSSSQRLARGAGQQASSLEETAASLEQLNSMARQNTENAHQAAQLTGDARKIVEDANQAMSQLKRSMEKIDAASGEMAKIINTIDEIAFQTNLLALNAAVEAARAGEAGAGFAVVADEVRNLAIRAAEAARNTSELIEDNINNIKTGSGLVGVTDKAFSGVVESVGKVKNLIGEIAAATNEQTQGIMQISRAMSAMDKITQANAAGAEEIAASMAMFKVGQNGRNNLHAGAGNGSGQMLLAPGSRSAIHGEDQF